MLLLAVLLCFALAACGADDSADDEQIVGDDWRTWGTIDDYGTITLDGEETEVCVCVGEDDASFYYDEPELQSYDLSQMFIDARYQSRGYGKAAVRAILDELKADGQSDKVTLCYIEGNETARKLYESFGFVEIDRDGDEIVMQLPLKASLV